MCPGFELADQPLFRDFLHQRLSTQIRRHMVATRIGKPFTGQGFDDREWSLWVVSRLEVGLTRLEP